MCTAPDYGTHYGGTQTLRYSLEVERKTNLTQKQPEFIGRLDGNNPKKDNSLRHFTKNGSEWRVPLHRGARVMARVEA